jgi:exopolysaccharide biosynthesis polyprenyl glycosylphosphotransferase
MLWIMDQCRAEEVEFKLVPDLFELAMDRVNIHEVAGLPLIGLKPARISGWNYWVKRSMDLFVALVVLIAGAVPMALIALAIKMDSDGPVLFRQERVGRNGRRFICYKFRTMVRDAETLNDYLEKEYGIDGRLIKHRQDPRRTRVGRVLRRASLDELPQFFNVLLGEMSVVGPRPPVPAEVARYDEWHHGRLLVTPGLTGLWQVSGRSNLTFDEMVRLDLYYAEHWSPWLDLKVILRTIPAVLTARGAY